CRPPRPHHARHLPRLGLALRRRPRRGPGGGRLPARRAHSGRRRRRLARYRGGALLRAAGRRPRMSAAATAGPVTPPAGAARLGRRLRRAAPWVWLVPSIALFVPFFILPMAVVLRNSFN